MNSNYKKFIINKRGKKRELITYANEEQKIKHRKIKEFLENHIYFSIFTKAYVENSSIYKNARAHMYNDIFYKFDIKNFFESIDHRILLKVLLQELNKNTHKDRKKFTKYQISSLIKECIVFDTGLPLGLITSPILANIYLKEFDNIFYGKLKQLELENIIYTRYADDITVSFKSKEIDTNMINLIKDSIESTLVKLLSRYSLKLNFKKNSVINLNKSNHVRITGLSITKDVNNYRNISVGKKKVAELYDDSLRIYFDTYKKEVLSEKEKYEIKRIKGYHSFVISIHKNGYSHMLSNKMILKINKIGYDNLESLIESFSIN